MGIELLGLVVSAKVSIHSQSLNLTAQFPILSPNILFDWALSTDQKIDLLLVVGIAHQTL